MSLLIENIKAILKENNTSLEAFLKEHQLSSLSNIKLTDLEKFCNEYNVSLENMLLYNLSFNRWKLKFIKLLILDVDGVMTDGGMYFTENGDQMKRYNTKDGMAILSLANKGVEIGIISSGFKQKMVKERSKLLQIDKLYVGRKPKLDVLKEWCKSLKIELSEVGIIGDDINDLGVMREVGFSAAPSDAVPVVKKTVDLVLQKKGGEGCVRELIDYYLLDSPLTR